MSLPIKKKLSCKNIYLYLQLFIRILERVAPRLSHTNAGVVLSASKVLMKFMDYLTNPDLIR